MQNNFVFYENICIFAEKEIKIMFNQRRNCQSYMKNTKISYRVTTKGGGWSKFNSIEGAITYYKKLYIQGIKQQILNIIKVTEEYLPQEEIDKINKEIQK